MTYYDNPNQEVVRVSDTPTEPVDPEPTPEPEPQTEPTVEPEPVAPEEEPSG